MVSPKKRTRWSGFYIVLDERGEPMRDCLRVLPEEARTSAAAQLGSTWDDLDARGFVLQPVELWTDPP